MTKTTKTEQPEAIRTGKLRSAFYGLSDGMFGLKGIAKNLEDGDLETMTDEVANILNRISQHLDTKYDNGWD